METISAICNLSTTLLLFGRWGISDGLTEVVGRKDLILQRMLRANGNNGLISVEGTEAAGALARLLAPLHLLFQHMEQCYDVTETAVGRGKKELEVRQKLPLPGIQTCPTMTYL